MTAATPPDRALSHVSSVFPALSETFVYREVRELRRRGWTVHSVTLRESPEHARPEFADLTGDLTTVYAGGAAAWTGRAALELLRHPLRGAATLWLAMRDAALPGERTALTDRAKVPVQALAGLALARALRPRSVGHVHAHFAHAPAAVAMYAARQLGVPFSFTGHANDLFQRRSLLRRKLQRASFVCCISEWHREWYTAVQPREPDAYPVVRCGVDVDAWSPPGSPRPANGRLEVLSLSRLVEKKGTDTLLRALRRLVDEGDTATHVTIAGDGPERARLEGLAAELDLRDRASFVGALPNDEVRRRLASADVFALPCRDDARGDRDGIPVVLMEAMACGLPVVTGDLPAIRELVEPERGGLLVQGADSESTARALTRLRTDEELRERLARSGRERVAEEFSLAVNVARFERALRSAASASAS